jgi:DNA-binding NtrC family response regulator
MQAPLLRFAETGEVQRVGADGATIRTDVRLISATNRDLRAQMASGAFREDLYYRLNALQISIPPLRERREDIALLLDHYFHRVARDHGRPVPKLTPEATGLLTAYAWTGNVRELRNVAERLVVSGLPHPLRSEDLPLEIRAARTVSTVSALAAPTDAPTPSTVIDARVQQLWDRMAAGEDFWAVVRQAFEAREITRLELAALVDRGLRETRGSYRTLLKLFHLQPHEYKRFHGFLRQQQCTPPLAPYRGGALAARRRVPPPSDQKAS